VLISRNMKILLASSEVVPFAKTGGLADVCGALPAALREDGHEVVVCLPAYKSAMECGLPIERTGTRLELSMGHWEAAGELYLSQLPESDVPVWLVGHDGFFGRDGIYQDHNGDFGDNCQRFSFFSRFLLECLAERNWFPDVIHCNDWQTGLVPALLETRYRSQPGYDSIATLMTVHNLAYQGMFSPDLFSSTGMDRRYFHWQAMEYYGNINLLKTGLVFADAISTVSPRYAREIQTAEHGCGLENVLRERADRLFGLLNGIDTREWDPQNDASLAARFGIDNWREGKQANKEALQRETGLPRRDVPLIGLVGRLVSQKGWSLILPVMRDWLSRYDVQWAVLGSGEQRIEDSLRDLRARHPDRLAVGLGFSGDLAHRIEASSDIFLMPSLYEPCGLNQMYSMRYGTVPVVHRTGGLADTVFDLNDENLLAGTANGFSFEHFDQSGLQWALGRAVNTLIDRPEVWETLVKNGMSVDWSWRRSARRYEELYRWLIALRRSAGK
jgi:starch synthase